MKSNLIASCGMNCGICLAYLREKNNCRGCKNSNGEYIPYCGHCAKKNCIKLKDTKKQMCYECDVFPCAKIKQLDKRYRLRYHMSMIDNLNMIKEVGMRKFLANEKRRWTCKYCGETICVHRENCIFCGKRRDDLN